MSAQIIIRSIVSAIFLLSTIESAHLAQASDASIFCASQKNFLSPGFAQVEKDWDASLTHFANQPGVANHADDTLAQLISKKSPLLDSWMVKEKLYGKEEELIVRAWRRYYAETQLVTYPGKDLMLNKKISQWSSQIYAEELSKEKRKKISSLFLEAQAKVLERLRKIPGSAPIIQRVKRIHLHWLEDLLREKQKHSLLDFFEWGIAYDPVPNRINIGLHVLQYPNDATIFAVFAHEIGHSFDSCRWGAFFSGTNPFEKVQACLRDGTSVGALSRDDSELASVAEKNHLGADFMAALKANPTCNREIYPPPGVQADQLAESFADWFSAEVVADSIYAQKGLRADLCMKKELRSGSSYPENAARLEKIYLAQPKIRERLQLKPLKDAARYCDFH